MSILGQHVETTGTFQDFYGSHTYTMSLSVTEQFLCDSNYVATEKTCENTNSEICIDNYKEFIEKLNQLFDKYSEIYADEIEKYGYTEYGPEFEVEYNEFADEEPFISSTLFIEMNLIRYEAGSGKATLYEYCNRGHNAGLSVGEDVQGYDDFGVQVAYPGSVVYATANLYINGELKDTLTLGNYIEPDETIEVDWVKW